MSAAPPLRRVLGALGAAGLVAAAVTGCGFSKDLYSTQGFSAPGTPYGAALARDTRHAELYQGFDTVAKGWATWKSPEFRRAYAEASARAYGLDAQGAEAPRGEDEKSVADAWEFHLALYTPTKNWNDLESPSSLWRLHLDLPGGREVGPETVGLAAKSEKNPVQYPYATAWTKEYVVRFPKPEGASAARPVLALAGPLGRMTFDFRAPGDEK